MVLHENKGCRWYSFPSFDALPGVVTFVTTRNGVVHGDVYSTDNMGEYTGDNPDRVILRSENKEYDDIEIEKKEICDLFIVENIIRIDSRI